MAKIDWYATINKNQNNGETEVDAVGINGLKEFILSTNKKDDKNSTKKAKASTKTKKTKAESEVVDEVASADEKSLEERLKKVERDICLTKKGIDILLDKYETFEKQMSDLIQRTEAAACFQNDGLVKNFNRIYTKVHLTGKMMIETMIKLLSNKIICSEETVPEQNNSKESKPESIEIEKVEDAEVINSAANESNNEDSQFIEDSTSPVFNTPIVKSKGFNQARVYNEIFNDKTLAKKYEINANMVEAFWRAFMKIHYPVFRDKIKKCISDKINLRIGDYLDIVTKSLDGFFGEKFKKVRKSNKTKYIKLGDIKHMGEMVNIIKVHYRFSDGSGFYNYTNDRKTKMEINKLLKPLILNATDDLILAYCAQDTNIARDLLMQLIEE